MDSLKTTSSTDGGPDDNPELIYDFQDGITPEIGLPVYAVSTGTLGLYIRDTLYAIAGRGPAVNLTLVYTCRPSRIRSFGRSWCCIYESVLERTGNQITLRKGTGGTVVFHIPAPGSPTAPAEAAPAPGVYDRLIDYGEYWLFYEKSSRLIFRFGRQAGPAMPLDAVMDYDGNTLQVLYNPDGTLRALTDAPGRTVTFLYGDQHLCTGIQLPDGRRASFQYDAQKNLASVTDLAGIPVRYGYDARHSLTSIRAGPEDAVTAFSYVSDALGNRVGTVTLPDGAVKRYELVSKDPVRVRVTHPGGRVVQFVSRNGMTEQVIDSRNRSIGFGYTGGKRTSFRDAEGRSAGMEYDGRGNLVREVYPDGTASVYQYDLYDNLVLEVDRAGQRTTSEYDARQHLVRSTAPSGRSFSFAYDAAGQLVRTTDPSGNSVSYEYDRFGNIAQATGPAGNAVRYSYDETGLQLRAVTDSRGSTYQFEYDGNDRLLRMICPDGSSVRWSHATRGRESMTDQNNHTTRYARRADGKVTGKTLPSGARYGFRYDAAGRMAALTDASGRTTEFVYDEGGDLREIRDRIGGAIRFTPDESGTVAGIRNQNGNLLQFTRNADGLLESVTDAAGATTRTVADILGRPVSFANARGNVTVLSYTPDNEIATVTGDGVTLHAFSYDPNGNMIAAADTSGTTLYSYNARDLLEKIRFPDNLEVSWEYDSAGNITRLTYPDGLQVRYEYDAMDRVIRMAWGEEAIRFTCDPAGSVTGEERSNGTTSTYGFDEDQRIAAIVHAGPSGTIAALKFRRDPDGNIVEAEGTSLLTPPEPAQLLPGGPSVSVYNAADQLVTAAGGTFAYDRDGSLTGISGPRTLSARYDPLNRPVEIVHAGGATQYRYGAAGPRAARIRGGQETRYYYTPSGFLLFETGSDGSLVRSCLWADGYLVALSMPGRRTFFCHCDQNGSVLALTDHTGAVAAAYAYDPFGNVIHRDERGVNSDVTFCGAYGVLDEGGGLYFMKHRFYDAVTGRFLQKDPVLLEGGLNPYQYAGNNPVMFIDPEGRAPNAAVRPQARPQTASSSFWDYKRKFDTFVESTARNVANNPYVRQVTGIGRSVVQHKLGGLLPQARNNFAVRVLQKAQQNIRTGGPPRIPPTRLPTCREIQRAAVQETGRYTEYLYRNALEHASSAGVPLSGVQRMADGAELLYHATAEKNPGLAADAAKDYIADQGKAMLHATAGAALSGNDVTADFNLKEHIMSQISGE